MAFQKMEAVVKGYVQGVGFRFFAERMANLLGITGWVLNLPGGDVKVLAVGTEDKIHEFLMVLERGPLSAEVEKVESTITSVDYNDYNSFEILS